MLKPLKLAENLYLIDDLDLSLPERTGTYVLIEEAITIIETAASPSIPFLLEGLQQLQISPEDIEYIIVTHIHLDHAGSAGLLLEHCPKAKVIVHPKGARHLADPSRLIAGAQAVYGDKFTALFDPILPVPTDRLLIKQDQDKLEIGKECSLVFYDTPGHANHHFSIYYPKENGMFTGDTTGIFYPQLFRDGVEFYLPTTSPNQFDPDKMLDSIKKYENMKLNAIFFGHFGMSQSPNEVYRQVRMWLNIFISEAEQTILEYKSFDDRVNHLSNRLLTKVSVHLKERGISKNHPSFEAILLDLEICAMGLVDYLEKRGMK